MPCLIAFECADATQVEILLCHLSVSNHSPMFIQRKLTLLSAMWDSTASIGALIASIS